MKPFTQRPLTTAQATSTGTADTKSFAAPSKAGGCFITVETNPARVTLDGTTPAAGAGIVIPKDSAPVFIPVGSGTTIKAASTIAGNSIINVVWLA